LQLSVEHAGATPQSDRLDYALFTPP
jgi:hypothetical protein